jgi:hypothetical protein
MPVERCLACEAVESKGTSLGVPNFCQRPVARLRLSGPRAYPDVRLGVSSALITVGLASEARSTTAICYLFDGV